MKARLRKVCKECTESSLTTYFYNIRALARMAGHQEIPNNHRWINAALLKKIKSTMANVASVASVVQDSVTVARNEAKAHEVAALASRDSISRTVHEI